MCFSINGNIINPDINVVSLSLAFFRPFLLISLKCVFVLRFPLPFFSLFTCFLPSYLLLSFTLSFSPLLPHSFSTYLPFFRFLLFPCNDAQLNKRGFKFSGWWLFQVSSCKPWSREVSFRRFYLKMETTVSFEMLVTPCLQD
jgi:hypothetical protein